MQIYYGQDPQLIDCDTFKTIIPLTRIGTSNVPIDVPMAGGLSDSARRLLQALTRDQTLSRGNRPELLESPNDKHPVC